jgi:hypothetical protein
VEAKYNKEPAALSKASLTFTLSIGQYEEAEGDDGFVY